MSDKDRILELRGALLNIARIDFVNVPEASLAGDVAAILQCIAWEAVIKDWPRDGHGELPRGSVAPDFVVLRECAKHAACHEN